MLFNKGRWDGQHCVAGCVIVLPEEEDVMRDMAMNQYESPADREMRERNEYAARLTQSENEYEERMQREEEERLIREEEGTADE